MIHLNCAEMMNQSSQGLWSNMLIVAILLILYGIYHFFFKEKKDGFILYIRQFLLWVTMTSGFFVYFIGYQIGNSQGHSSEFLSNILESIFSTTRLFILGNDLVEIDKTFVHNNPIFHAFFSLTVFLAAFVFISFLVHVFFKSMLIRCKVRKTNKSENHFFFGINQSTLSLSSDLLENKKDRLVVFVNDFFENDNQQLYSHLHQNAFVINNKSLTDSISLEKEEGLFQIFKNKKQHIHSIEHKDDVFINLKILTKKIVKTETHLYFLTEDEDWNIKYAKHALNELQKLDHEKKVRIHICTFNGVSEKHFAEYSNLSSIKITVVVHHFPSIVSQQLINEHHPVNFVGINSDSATAKTDFNALVIGFGQVGTHVLRKLIEQGLFVGSTFHATVIDKYMNILKGRFEHLYPAVNVNYDIDFIDAEAGNSSFYSAIKKVIENTNYIVIALGNDALNIQTAMELLEINSIRNKNSLKIFIQLEEVGHWKETLNDFENQICIFGEIDKVFSEKNILQREVEKRGILVHRVYSELYGDNRSFDKITRLEQLSNISVAEHLYAKVKLLGYKSLDEFSSKLKSNDDYLTSLSDVQKLNLSIGEHLRWNAFHFIHGWTTLTIDDLKGTSTEEKYTNRKNVLHRKHSCLISWDQLKELEKEIGKDMQKADIDSVENLYKFINHNSRHHND